MTVVRRISYDCCHTAFAPIVTSACVALKNAENVKAIKDKKAYKNT
jgi:hypothetical protein